MKIILFIFTMYFATIALADSVAVSVEPPTQPTKASEPIPSYTKTQNMDTVLTEQVQSAINKNPLLKNQAISAVSINSKVTLEGSVQTREQETEAINTAKSIPGIKNVTSQLTIENK